MIRLFGFLCMVLLLCCSCTSEYYNSSGFLAGEQFTDSNLRVMLIDTLTVTTSTIKFDSIITSEATRMLIGSYEDPVFGTVSASSYLGMIPSSYTIDTEAEFDSIVLYLMQDSYYYNDTLATNSIRVKSLTETLRAAEDEYYYNIGNVEYSEKDLAVFSYTPRPLDKDTLEIRLTDTLGINLFHKFREKEITSNDQFRDYFKGLALLPVENDEGSIIGFSKDSNASYLTIYYSTAEENEREQHSLNIILDETLDPVPFFNQIKAVDPISPLNTLVDQEVELNSEDVNNLSYIQSGIGITTKISIPFLRNIHDINGKGTVLDAVLKIRPSPNSYDENLDLRDSLSVYVVDRNNDLVSQLYLAESLPARGILNRENQEFGDIYYEISLGSYLEELLTTERETEDELILLPNNYNSTVDRFILNAMDSSEYSAVLELTYVIYDNEDN